LISGKEVPKSVFTLNKDIKTKVRMKRPWTVNETVAKAP